MKYAQVPKDILPTLIIGLGGTGYQIIKRLKLLFAKRYGKAKLPIRYLLIDTDLKSFIDDTLDNSEKCQLRFGDGIKNTLDWAYDNPSFGWLPQNPKITPDFFTATDQGAGLMRPIGRLYFCKNAKLVYDLLVSAKNDLVDLHKVLTDLDDNYVENIDRHKVYIVGSLAGGTGCGIFLDVSVMLSNIFNRDTTNLIGMFTLESCYDDKLASDVDAQSRSKANCYAALKELEFFMSSVTNPGDSKYSFKYSNVGELRLDKKLLDVCYLIENRNEGGGVLSNIEDIYDLCTLQLFQEVGTTLGSQLRADYTNFICKEKDPVLKKERCFSTFSSSSMEFPIEGLRKYCTYMLAGEVLDTLSKEKNYDEQYLEDETNKLLEEINGYLEMENYQRDFVNNLKISSHILYEELEGSKIDNLDKVGRYVEEKRHRWLDNKLRVEKDIEQVLSEYIKSRLLDYGVKYVLRVTSRIESKLYNEYNDSLVTSSKDKGKVKYLITSIQDKRVIKGREPIDPFIINEFNSYLDLEQKKLRHDIYKERYKLMREVMKDINNSLNKLLSDLRQLKSDVSSEIEKLSYQSQRKYGGNIISRDMASKEYYDEYYNSKFSSIIQNKIASMFNARGLTEVIKGGSKEIISLCQQEFDKTSSNTTIMDIMARNAVMRNQSIQDYVKGELDLTSRLAQPFWTAVKNPEVAWTECYYIGCMRDDDINNGFTIKAPEPIDRWIRNQTGERSRQARYVETTNPYAVDIIHITMGACAAYLPDVKHYKQFYMRFLTSRIYPLHLDEKYIGLEELDMDTEKLLEYYSMAKSLGAIFEVEGSYYVNIKRHSDGYRYIYSCESCLKDKEYSEGQIDDLPEKKSKVPEKLKLGDSYNDTLQYINHSLELKLLFQGFIENVHKKFTGEQIRKHCINYIKNKVSEDFIANEKVMNKMESVQ
jgi:hypothetical protein